MKTTFITLCILCFSVTLFAQLKTTVKCPVIEVDVLNGIINHSILPSSTVGEIKLHLPCFTSFEDESATAKCGGGVSYKKDDVYFFTSRDYVEIGPAFTGKLSLPLMGASRNNLFHWLGAPQIKEAHWEAFQTSYGILILYYDTADKINKIQFSSKTAQTIQLCE